MATAWRHPGPDNWVEGAHVWLSSITRHGILSCRTMPCDCRDPIRRHSNTIQHLDCRDMLSPDAIEDRIAQFKLDLTKYSTLNMARRHIIFGECATISADEYFDLRSRIAKLYSVHPNEVIAVGSGKLGFSISPRKRYRHFSNDSDLDVVIISEELFDRCWRELFRYENQGGYWEKAPKLKEYLFRGWIRPDMMPPDGNFDFGKRWWEFFNGLSASRDYSISRIRGAIYKNWSFLEAYQSVAVDQCSKHSAVEREK
ncbi:hypothetical protein ThimaDRAFT_4634 [Thiocapsa marina 5811]|uniref:Uncharacterized protein n=2 Tax=Thiocapsa marina TaxID=244573 RepID=F9UI81_9GAMM|nr:hypothetical protein ThimaDRAFT_4634 [Thiocapsa marina 5811]